MCLFACNIFYYQNFHVVVDLSKERDEEEERKTLFTNE
jgi:hypothetical protein